METLKTIHCAQDDFAILGSIRNVLKLMYEFYFARKEKKSENALKNVFRFLKELDISPYLVNQKTCFMIFFFTCISESPESNIGISRKIENMKFK
mmetsp:Transcript_30684/g.30147  ORF Transcript_30684/g.30147 Transcript_30684/m.30147 type:complete len:95 (+) Transcript_30684:346-630(+)